MPKETLRAKYSRNHWVSVGWSNDDVQVGVSAGTYFVFTDKQGNPVPVEESYGLPTPGVADSLYFSLNDRNQVNELIRNLRKARDSAYGRDE